MSKVTRVLLAAVGVAVLAGAVVLAVLAPGDSDGEPFGGLAPREPVIDDAALPAGSRALLRGVDPLAPRVDGPVYEVSADGRSRRAGSLVCKVVHESAAGRGLCLKLADGDSGYEGLVFDADRRPLRSFAIRGVPDRVRVSRDGRYAGFTTFDSGSSQGYFADADDFSTDTRIVDLRSGRTALSVSDDMAVTRDGKRFALHDAQFWGVTFARGDRFYATMADAFDRFLIEGDVRTGRARVLAKGVECPSLSPDGTRIAYKRRIPYSERWRFHVLDLRTRRDVALAEPRSIDDQPEWWGNDRVAYSDDRTVFAVPADGSGEPRRVAEHAVSPAFLAD